MKLLQLFNIIFLLFSISISTSYAKEKLVKKNILIKEFSEVEISGYFKVKLVKSKQCKLEIEARDDILDIIKVSEKNNILKIRLDEENKETFKHKVYLTIYFKDLSKVTTYGLVKLYTEEEIKFKDLMLESNGIIKAYLELKANYLSVVVNGTGKLQLFGRSNNATFEINGAGIIDAYTMSISKCDVEISGAGSAKLYVQDELEVDLSGISKVTYKGNPIVKKNTTSFLSKIKHIEE